MHLNDLSDSDFEELVYDLMECIGFKNVNWRKGTGKFGRAADQGRDITAEEVRTSPDGRHTMATRPIFRRIDANSVLFNESYRKSGPISRRRGRFFLSPTDS